MNTEPKSITVYQNNTAKSLVDPGGGALSRTQFFRFRIHFCQKARMSEVWHPQRVGAPQREILDPPLEILSSSVGIRCLI